MTGVKPTDRSLPSTSLALWWPSGALLIWMGKLRRPLHRGAALLGQLWATCLRPSSLPPLFPFLDPDKHNDMLPAFVYLGVSHGIPMAGAGVIRVRILPQRRADLIALCRSILKSGLLLCGASFTSCLGCLWQSGSHGVATHHPAAGATGFDLPALPVDGFIHRFLYYSAQQNTRRSIQHSRSRGAALTSAPALHRLALRLL